MNDSGSPPYISALQDFQRARRKAILEQLVARLTGRSTETSIISQQ